MATAWRVGAWKIRSRHYTVATGFWEQDLVESFVGGAGASSLFSPPSLLFLLLLYLLFSLFFPILCSSIPILSLLSRHSVIQLRLTLTPSEAKNDHAHLIFLPLPPDCWDHSHKPQHPAYETLGISSRPRLYMLGTLPTEPKSQSWLLPSLMVISGFGMRGSYMYHSGKVPDPSHRLLVVTVRVCWWLCLLWGGGGWCTYCGQVLW